MTSTERTLFTGPLSGYDVPPSESADAKAKALSWAANTRKAYVGGWKHFTSWCIENRCPGLTAIAADVGGYPAACLRID